MPFLSLQAGILNARRNSSISTPPLGSCPMRRWRKLILQERNLVSASSGHKSRIQSGIIRLELFVCETTHLCKDSHREESVVPCVPQFILPIIRNLQLFANTPQALPPPVDSSTPRPLQIRRIKRHDVLVNLHTRFFQPRLIQTEIVSEQNSILSIVPIHCLLNILHRSLHARKIRLSKLESEFVRHRMRVMDPDIISDDDVTRPNRPCRWWESIRFESALSEVQYCEPDFEDGGRVFLVPFDVNSDKDFSAKRRQVLC